MARHVRNEDYEVNTNEEYAVDQDLSGVESASFDMVEDEYESVDDEGDFADGEDDFGWDEDSVELSDSVAAVVPAVAPAADDAGKKGKKQKKEIPYYMRKSRRNRRILIAAAILLVVLIGALGYLTFQLLEESRQLADEQAQEQLGVDDVDKIKDEVTQDIVQEAVKKTSAPDLAGLMGLNVDQVIEALQRGAKVTSTKSLEKPADEKDGESKDTKEEQEDVGPIKTTVTISLTEDPVDKRAGTPTVYLGLDKDGLVIQAGYSASAALLGYGAYSFVDAVENNFIIERTLQEAGIAVAEGSAKLPEDKSSFRTYGKDGVTLTKEYCPFSGKVTIDGSEYDWSAVLSYDYSVANAAGSTNLSDTIRIIYVYLEVPLS